MPIRIRLRLPAGKIRAALLLMVVPIAMLIPGSDAVFSQTGTGIAAQAPLFTAIDLNPEGFVESYASGVSDGQQVGYGYGAATGGYGHALLWHGTAASVVDLHPRGFMISRVLGVSGGQQVGVGISPQPIAGAHALLWRGSAASLTDLNPHGFVRSEATGVSGGQQVGWGYGPATGEHRHALLWRGTTVSMVDLHPRGFTETQALSSSGGQQVGSGYGPATRLYGFPEDFTHALLWRGSAASVVDLHAGRSLDSHALGIAGGEQVGWTSVDVGTTGVPVWATHALLWRGTPSSMIELQAADDEMGGEALATNGGEQVGVRSGRALLWRGSAAGMVDLQVFLPPGFEQSIATAIDSNGNIVGVAWGPATDDRAHAFLWTQNVNTKPGTTLPLTATSSQRGQGAHPSGSLCVYSSSSSPAELLLTDPLGNQTGFDPITNAKFQDIRESTYFADQLCREGYPFGLPPFKSVDVVSSGDGQYTLDVIGTESGDFDVYVGIYDGAGNRIYYSYSGTTALGHFSRFTFPGKISVFAAFGATLKIDSASQAFDVNGTFAPGPDGTISPMTQPVTIETTDQVHTFLVMIPAGSFRQIQQGTFGFEGEIRGIHLAATLARTDGKNYTFEVRGTGAPEPSDLPSGNPIDVRFAIGNNAGSTLVTATFVP